MKTVSIISILYGVFGLFWSAATMVIMRVQEAIFTDFPWPPEVREIVDIPALMDTAYSIVGTLFPFVILVAILYIISGILQLSGKPAYKNLAYAAAVMNILWYLAYIVIVQLELVPVLNSVNICPVRMINLIILVGMLFNAALYCAYPVFLILYIRTGFRAWDTLNTGYTS